MRGQCNESAHAVQLENVRRDMCRSRLMATGVLAYFAAFRASTISSERAYGTAS